MIHEEKGNDGQLVADFSSLNATLQQITLHEENFRKCILCDPFFKCLDLTPEVLSCF